MSLVKISDPDRLSVGDRPFIRRQFFGKHAQQRRLATAVFPDDADAVMPSEDVAEIREERPFAVALGDPFAFDRLFPQTGRSK